MASFAAETPFARHSRCFPNHPFRGPMPADPFVTLDFLQSVIGDDMAAVDRVLRTSLRSDVALIRQIADYIIGGGGKRLRPALLLLAASACGYAGRDHHTLAAVIEMIHTATLLHGHATANAQFGNPAAVLVGDFLYSRTFQLMVGVNRIRVLAIIADATNLIAEGEVMQLMHTGNAALDEGEYFAGIERKTAKLFEAAGRLGAVLGDASPEREEALARYGMHLGTAFQIMDDVLDYSGDAAHIGKNLGDDLAEGKMTLPLIRALAVGTREDAQLIRHAVGGGGLTDFRPVVEALERTGALVYAREQARVASRSAADSLAVLPSSPAAASLL